MMLLLFCFLPILPNYEQTSELLSRASVRKRSAVSTSAISKWDIFVGLLDFREEKYAKKLIAD
jgi:hypothetical protein